MKSVLNEGSVIERIKDALKKIEQIDSVANNSGSGKGDLYLGGSISEYTKDLIMTYPVMCDNSLPASTMSMISRANERNIVSMLQMMFSAATLRGKNGADIIKMVHKNININCSISDYIDAVDDFATTAQTYSNNLAEAANYRRIARKMSESLREVYADKVFPTNSFSEKSLNEYVVTKNMYGNTVVKEDIIGYDATGDNGFQKNNVDAMVGLNKAPYELQKYQIDAYTKQLLDSEVKKANELQPTLMVINYILTDPSDKNKIYDRASFVTGVKSRVISVDPSDIIERLAAKNKTKVSFLNIIRATTGEIKLVRDFLLCVDQAKIDAKNAVKKGPSAKMWKVLENRSNKNNLKKFLRNGNDASAITTLVVNQETVYALKKEFEFDLENEKNARMIMDTFNLLGLVICDESIEAAKFLYAGNSTFETIAYSYLEKEGKDNSYKKVVNLIGKMNGR